jgi:hypothetical protein
MAVWKRREEDKALEIGRTAIGQKVEEKTSVRNESMCCEEDGSS